MKNKKALMQPQTAQTKQRSNWWIWLIIILIVVVIGIVIYFVMSYVGESGIISNLQNSSSGSGGGSLLGKDIPQPPALPE